MKRFTGIKMAVALCMTLGVMILPFNQMNVHAEESTTVVQGSVMKGTTSDLLLLDTNEGKMEIKIDSTTDTSGAKILLTNSKIYVSVKHGSDAYLHAVKITSDTQSSSVNVDTSNSSTIMGTLGEKTTNTLLYVNTQQGEMQIKLDPTTNISGINVLVAGKTYTISCARGSDAYMHAISISDSTSAMANGIIYGSSTTHATIGTAPNNASTMSVTGNVSKNTKEDILFLLTSGGEMQFKIDSGADTIDGMIHTYNNKETVSYYHGSDGYLHAISIKGDKDAYSTATIQKDKAVTVTGTVEDESTDKILFLNTSGGVMELKLDAVNSLNNCKALIKDKKVSVSCAHGSDAYMHALDITSN